MVLKMRNHLSNFQIWKKIMRGFPQFPCYTCNTELWGINTLGIAFWLTDKTIARYWFKLMVQWYNWGQVPMLPVLSAQFSWRKPTYVLSITSIRSSELIENESSQQSQILTIRFKCMWENFQHPHTWEESPTISGHSHNSSLHERWVNLLAWTSSN